MRRYRWRDFHVANGGGGEDIHVDGELMDFFRQDVAAIIDLKNVFSKF